ncbi:hypothetical protein DFP72DRAFT_1075288 [Ephemerocybe angulata]|uniref:Uncharacterized protein n=1 Tax=Ephemerocybe angulata TaxID=980116 RepID=A0A8H6HJC3_9AGAR|nr:hypothetical protein DFP72DRAFT_1075288 [Tulosesus angulatus]
MIFSSRSFHSPARHPPTPPPDDWYIPTRPMTAEAMREVDKWVELIHHFKRPAYIPATIGDFKIMGIDDEAACEIRIRCHQPYDPNCIFVDLEQWKLEMRIELASGAGRPVDIGHSPWIHLAFFEGDRTDRWAPSWVQNYFVESFVGYHSRAHVLEIIDTLLYQDASMPNHQAIQRWSCLASNWFNSHLRTRGINARNIQELEGLLDEASLSIGMGTLSL